MSVETIITIVFAAVAAVCSAAALVVALKRRGGGGTDAHTLRAENDRLREELTREIDYARKGIAESNRQSSVAVNDLLAKYLESAEKKTNAVTESLGRAMAQLAADEKASAEKTDAALSKNLEALKSDLKTGIVEMRADLQSQLAEVRKELTVNVDRMRGEMQTQLKEVRDDNEKQLERMRATVDEKLSETLEKRVETAFKQVSDRLESVQKGFGEMQQLTAKVGDLNRIFSDVKKRGNWGEVQLGRSRAAKPLRADPEPGAIRGAVPPLFAFAGGGGLRHRHARAVRREGLSPRGCQVPPRGLRAPGGRLRDWGQDGGGDGAQEAARKGQE